MEGFESRWGCGLSAHLAKPLNLLTEIVKITRMLFFFFFKFSFQRGKIAELQFGLVSTYICSTLLNIFPTCQSGIAEWKIIFSMWRSANQLVEMFTCPCWAYFKVGSM